MDNWFKKSRFALWGMLMFPTFLYGQSTFINVGKERGLPSLQIINLFQDKHGFVWIGCPNGLGRFDGYEVVPYFNRPGDTTSLSSNHSCPYAFAEDDMGNLWVATFRGGLNYFNRKTEQFIRYRAQPDRPNSLSMDKLLAIEADGRGGLWIATAGEGINHFDPKTERFRVWGTQKNRPDALMQSTLTSCLKLDTTGKLWIGTNNGICRYVPQKDSFEYFTFSPRSGLDISSKYVTAIEQDDRKNIWVGTSQGLNRWDTIKGGFEKFYFASLVSPKKPGYDYIFKILPCPDGRLWLGTNGGLLRFDPASGSVEQFAHDPTDPFSFPEGPVNAIMRDKEGNTWFGTNNGLSMLANMDKLPNHKRFLTVQQAFKKITQTEGINAVIQVEGAFWLATQTGIYRSAETLHLVKSGNFTSLFWDKEKKEVYGGTMGDGFFVFNSINFTQIRHTPRNRPGKESGPYSVKGNRITSFAKDAQGLIWVAAEGGLNRYNPLTEQLKKFSQKEKKLQNPSSNTNYHLLIDHHGNLWVASMGGLSRLSRAELSKPFDDADLHFEHFLHDPKNHNSISSDAVFCLLESTDGRIWAGTDAGLNCFIPEASGQVPEKGIWKRFFKTEGLPGNEIVVLVEDKNGNMWAGDAYEGLGKYDRTSSRFFRFSKKDGLNTDRFRPNAGLCSNEGFVVLGGRSGLAGFYPENLPLHQSTPIPLYFTDFKIFNKTVPIGNGDNELPMPIYKTDVIELDYDQKVISFQFTALNFVNPERQVYRYKLIPFNTDWQQNGNSREATFTNLDPGTYKLQVETSENGYDWSGKSLTLIIFPPWYRTWWAYLLYALAIGGFLYGARRFEMRRQLAKTEARHQAQLVRAETDRLKELDAFKTRFYTNITHEFRTPLTVILGNAQQLEKSALKTQQTQLTAIQRQGKQLLRLINQLLDLARLETGTVRVHLIQGDILLFLKYLVESFQSLAETKQIELCFENDAESFWMDYDPNHVQQIVGNLLFNAFKYTPDGGQVGLRAVTTVPDRLVVHVEDNGIGIPAGQLPRVFDRFYQVGEQQGGTGIGLALSRELARLLDGDLEAQSELGKGSIFTFTLPVTRQTKIQEPPALNPNQYEDYEEPENDPPLPPPSTDGKARPHLLLVEDNADVVAYLIGLLAKTYRIDVARDGQAGLDMALRLVPDLIISDVMMPGMDGFALCKTIKTDMRTSHIPIILLTAKADLDARIEGLGHGADAYLSKPFEVRELQVQLQMLHRLRQILRERFGNSMGVLPPTDDQKIRREDVFFQKLHAILEKNYHEETFGVPALCQKMNMSQSTLYRKLIALTGKSIEEYLRDFRLQKACELLLGTDSSVQKVAWDCGFKEPTHFMQVFRDKYGVTPSDFRAGHKTRDEEKNKQP